MSEGEAGISYDRLTPAWVLLMGKNLHYGYFEDPDDDLDEATGRLTRLMAEEARIEAGMQVLDVGCGVGLPSCFLAEQYGCRVTGITTSQTGLAEAGRLAATRGLADRVTFTEADGMDNRLPDAKFHRVWVMQSSHLMLHKQRLMAECARVLRPGGRMVLCDVVLREPMSMKQALEFRHEFLLLRQVFGQAKMEPLELYGTLAAAGGLTVESLRDISRQTRPTFDRWRRNASLHKQQVIALQGEERWQQFVDSCTALETLWARRKLGYGMMAAVKAA